MEKITDEVIKRVKAANAAVTEVHHLTHPELPDEVLVRPPSRQEWRIYQNHRHDADVVKRSMAPDVLVETCVIHPSREDLGKMLEAHPGLVETWAGDLVEIAGVTGQKTRKKV